MKKKGLTFLSVCLSTQLFSRLLCSQCRNTLRFSWVLASYNRHDRKFSQGQTRGWQWALGSPLWQLHASVHLPPEHPGMVKQLQTLTGAGGTSVRHRINCYSDTVLSRHSNRYFILNSQMGIIPEAECFPCFLTLALRGTAVTFILVLWGTEVGSLLEVFTKVNLNPARQDQASQWPLSSLPMALSWTTQKICGWTGNLDCRFPKFILYAQGYLPSI